MGLLAGLKKTYHILTKPIVVSNETHNPIDIENNYHIALIARRVFKVLATLTAIGFTISLLSREIQATFVFGTACLVFLVAVRQFSIYLQGSEKTKKYEKLLHFVQSDWGMSISYSHFEENILLLKKKYGFWLKTEMGNLLINKCWSVAMRQKDFSFLNACYICHKHFDTNHLTNESRLVSFRFQDATLQLPNYFRKYLKLDDLSRNEEDIHIKDRSWKKQILKLPSERLLARDHCFGIPAFQKSSKKKDFEERIHLLKTLDDSDSDDRLLRAKIQSVLEIPEGLLIDEVIESLKDAKVTSVKLKTNQVEIERRLKSWNPRLKIHYINS